MSFAAAAVEGYFPCSYELMEECLVSIRHSPEDVLCIVHLFTILLLLYTTACTQHEYTPHS
jgi:uncharacterized paraquat-inducible protein A